MSFDLSGQSRKLAVSDVSVTVSLLICHVYLNVQLLRMSEILALIERKATALPNELSVNFIDLWNTACLGRRLPPPVGDKNALF